MNDVYICYRRSFSASIALALFHALREQGCDVFMDVHPFDNRDAVDLAIYTPGSSAGLPLTVLRSFAAPPRLSLFR